MNHAIEKQRVNKEKRKEYKKKPRKNTPQIKTESCHREKKNIIIKENRRKWSKKEDKTNLSDGRGSAGSIGSSRAGPDAFSRGSSFSVAEARARSREGS